MRLCLFACACVCVQVRVYVLKADGLTPQDANGLADPYVKVKLGGQVQGDSSKCIKETLSPHFFSMYEFTTELPGESILTVRASVLGLIPCARVASFCTHGCVACV